jgi:hypothetical protein
VTRRIDEPAAHARVRWLTESEGGRAAPPPGPTYASTAVFIRGDDAEVVPDWPAGGEHFSVLLDFDGPVRDGVVDAKVEFMNRALVEDDLVVGSTFWVMEGRRAVAEARVLEVFDSPTSSVT